ncbi:hypothetical protein CFELI_12590 [Corynebacterium felinum]|nr:hypothetical protein CFELI_12590 [Corynebacterium felinum]
MLMSSPFGNSGTNSFGQSQPNSGTQSPPSFGGGFGQQPSQQGFETAPSAFGQQPAPAGGSSSPFGASTPDTSFERDTPPALAAPATGPWGFVSAATVAAFVGLICGVLAPVIGGSATDSGFRMFAIAGWVLSGIIAFVLVGVHKVVDNKRKSAACYLENSTHVALTRLALAVGAIGVVITAIEISLWVSKVF